MISIDMLLLLFCVSVVINNALHTYAYNRFGKKQTYSQDKVLACY